MNQEPLAMIAAGDGEAAYTLLTPPRGAPGFGLFLALLPLGALLLLILAAAAPAPTHLAFRSVAAGGYRDAHDARWEVRTLRQIAALGWRRVRVGPWVMLRAPTPVLVCSPGGALERRRWMLAEVDLGIVQGSEVLLLVDARKAASLEDGSRPGGPTRAELTAEEIDRRLAIDLVLRRSSARTLQYLAGAALTWALASTLAVVWMTGHPTESGPLPAIAISAATLGVGALGTRVMTRLRRRRRATRP